MGGRLIVMCATQSTKRVISWWFSGPLTNAIALGD